ncbi:unnamed protein product [Cladocopium goreaui]|uniref:Uncharacterized protein n=1 Tax=Cladocopium goreaui TaxID=2562237 RepID=A0A9P1GH55_9DINO|nr:unnamed protein product [Cladocopium goreaui]CAI4013826.1 unnamed protein product [Cladocopium goreaui]
MPDPAEDPVDAVKWMVQNLMKDLQEAKMWPIKMASMKHQEKLRSSLAQAAQSLEINYFELKAVVDEVARAEDQDIEFDLEPACFDILSKAVDARTDYHELAEQAAQLCKPVRKKKDRAKSPAAGSTATNPPSKRPRAAQGPPQLEFGDNLVDEFATGQSSASRAGVWGDMMHQGGVYHDRLAPVLREAHRDFLQWKKANKVECSQPRFTPARLHRLSCLTIQSYGK